MKQDAEALWRFIPAAQRATFERIAEVAQISNSAALALKLCQEALRDYCPAEERVRVLAVLASVEART